MTIAVSLLAMVVIAYFHSNAAVRIAEINDLASDKLAATQLEIANMFVRAGIIEPSETGREVIEEEPPEIPP